MLLLFYLQRTGIFLQELTLTSALTYICVHAYDLCFRSLYLCINFWAKECLNCTPGTEMKFIYIHDEPLRNPYLGKECPDSIHSLNNFETYS